jgi:hypothetical protein
MTFFQELCGITFEILFSVVVTSLLFLFMNSDDELDTTRQCVVVALDEEAHSHQQSTPSPTVTDDENIHTSLFG